MNKKKKVLAGVAGIGLIVALLFFTNALVGNPVSKALAKQAAQTYIDDHYAPLRLEIQSCGYNFKFSDYIVFAQSPTSRDTGFGIHVDSLGNVLRDEYEYEVANHFTTFRRLDEELRDLAQERLQGKLPYALDDLSLRFTKDIDLLALERDMVLDVHQPPQPLEVDVGVFSEELSYEKIAEVAKALEALLQAEQIPVATYSIRLLPMENRPEQENAAVSWGGALAVSEFPADRLGENNLPQAMEQYETERSEQLDREKEAERD